jgi:hypothetical protein
MKIISVEEFIIDEGIFADISLDEETIGEVEELLEDECNEK